MLVDFLFCFCLRKWYILLEVINIFILLLIDLKYVFVCLEIMLFGNENLKIIRYN